MDKIQDLNKFNFDASVSLIFRNGKKIEKKLEMVIISNDDFDRHLKFYMPRLEDMGATLQKVNFKGTFDKYEIFCNSLKRKRYSLGTQQCEIQFYVNDIMIKNQNYNKIKYYEIELFGINPVSKTLKMEGLEWFRFRKDEEPFWRFEVKQKNYRLYETKYDYLYENKYVNCLENILALFSGNEICSGNIKAYNEKDELQVARLKTPKYIFENKDRYYKGYIEIKKPIAILSNINKLLGYDMLFKYFINHYFQRYWEFRLAFTYQILEYMFNKFWKNVSDCKNCTIKSKVIDAFKCLDSDIINKSGIEPEEFFKLIKKMRNTYFHAGNLYEIKIEDYIKNINSEYIKWVPGIGQAIVATLIFQSIFDYPLSDINGIVVYK